MLLRGSTTSSISTRLAAMQSEQGQGTMQDTRWVTHLRPVTYTSSRHPIPSFERSDCRRKSKSGEMTSAAILLCLEAFWHRPIMRHIVEKDRRTFYDPSA